ncbi:MAG: hypothetical protein ACI84O_001274 [Myxococcota bacterium]|jgi:hypothetical protein
MRVIPIPSFVFFCMTLFLGSCQETNTAYGPANSPLSASPSRLQFDTIQYGQKATGTWVLTNDSDTDVVIKRIGPFSCQCVSAKLRLPQRNDSLQVLRGEPMNLVLQPKETAEIIFTLDTARYRKPVSRKIGSIPVVIANSSGMVLEWAADIYTPFVVSPWAVEVGNIGIREQATGRAVVAAHDANEFILDISGEYNGWHVQSNAVVLEGHMRSAYEVIFTAPLELPEGPFKESFVFHTNLPDAPPVKINVQGNVRSDIYAQPQRLLFDPSRGKTVQQFAIRQTADGEKAPRLAADSFAAQGFELLYSEKSTDEVAFYSLSYIGTPSPQGENGTLSIETDYPLQPTIELGFTILPQR